MSGTTYGHLGQVVATVGQKGRRDKLFGAHHYIERAALSNLVY